MFKNLSPARRRTLLWLLIAMVAFGLLAGGLGGITFQPGKNFSRNPFQLPTSNGNAEVGADSSEIFQILVRGVIAIAVVLLPISLISALLSKEGRRRLITNLILIGIFLFLADRIQKSPKREAEQELPPVEIGAPKLGTEAGEALPPLPPPPSETFVMITSVVVVLAGVSLAVWFSRGILFPKNLKPLDQIGREAEQARSDLASGRDVEDVVIRCYRQMSRVAQESRKLQRSESMTPHEFRDSLTKAGLPAAPVQSLTQIFEDVRYGGLTPGPAERQAAIDSLTAIAAACRTEKD